LASFSAITW